MEITDDMIEDAVQTYITTEGDENLAMRMAIETVFNQLLSEILSKLTSKPSSGHQDSHIPPERPLKEPVQADDGWIPYGNGKTIMGDCGFKMRDGRIYPVTYVENFSTGFFWQHRHELCDILAYRIINEPKLAPGKITEVQEAQKVENHRLTEMTNRMALNPKPAVVSEDDKLDEFLRKPQKWTIELLENSKDGLYLRKRKKPKKQTLLEYLGSSDPHWRDRDDLPTLEFLSEYLERNK